MANIVITSTNNSIKVDFGDFGSQLEMYQGVFRKDNIFFIRHNNYVEAEAIGMRELDLSVDNYSNDIENVISFKVDSIDGTTPTTNQELYNLLENLLA